jgi:hypothetical protein
MCGKRFKLVKLEAQGSWVAASVAVCGPACAEAFDADVGAPSSWRQVHASSQAARATA